MTAIADSRLMLGALTRLIEDANPTRVEAGVAAGTSGKAEVVFTPHAEGRYVTVAEAVRVGRSALVTKGVLSGELANTPAVEKRLREVMMSERLCLPIGFHVATAFSPTSTGVMREPSLTAARVGPTGTHLQFDDLRVFLLLVFQAVILKERERANAPEKK